MVARPRSAIAARRFAATLVALAVVALAVSLAGSGSSARELTIVSPTATWMAPGLQVRVAGQPVGHIVSAQPTRAGTARVRIQIDDSAIWPLPQGTQAVFRWAGTIAFTNRYVELVLPKPDGHTLAYGATIRGSDVAQTVEFDQLFSVFNPSTRSATKQLLNRGGPALQTAQPGFAAALGSAPSALTQARLALQELGSDPAELSALVTSADSVVHAIDAANPGLSQLISGAATTLGATAAQSIALGRTLQEMPSTLSSAQATLLHTDATLVHANRLLARLSPGVTAVKSLAPGLNTLLHSVLQVGPSAYSTLASLRGAVPDLNPLLDTATGLMPKLQTIGQLGTKELTCIRPYAPEAAGLASTWDGFIQYSDKHDKYARVNGGVYPYPLSEMPLTSAQIVKLFPSLHYVFPAPPGQAAGQPWFNSACGVGPDSLNAAADPEHP